MSCRNSTSIGAPVLLVSRLISCSAAIPGICATPRSPPAADPLDHVLPGSFRIPAASSACTRRWPGWSAPTASTSPVGKPIWRLCPVSMSNASWRSCGRRCGQLPGGHPHRLLVVHAHVLANPTSTESAAGHRRVLDPGSPISIPAAAPSSSSASDPRRPAGTATRSATPGGRGPSSSAALSTAAPVTRCHRAGAAARGRCGGICDLLGHRAWRGRRRGRTAAACSGRTGRRPARRSSRRPRVGVLVAPQRLDETGRRAGPLRRPV